MLLSIYYGLALIYDSRISCISPFFVKIKLINCRLQIFAVVTTVKVYSCQMFTLL